MVVERVLGIDPGATSGVVVLAAPGAVVLSATSVSAEKLCLDVRGGWPMTAEPGLCWATAIEHVGHYGTGRPVGKDVFDTCILIGRLLERLEPQMPAYLYRRQTIKTLLCGSPTAGDPHVRQALIDRWGGDRVALGGVKCPACKGKGWVGRGRPPCEACGGGGWEAPPGPLRSVTGHAWAALAVARYHLETAALRGA